MNTIAEKVPFTQSISAHKATALEHDFPIVEVSQVAEQESWRKEINRPIYHIHKWWATRLGSVFRAITLAALSGPTVDTWKGFYERHRLTGKVVLDPFMGSGTTLGEAIKLGAKAVGCDINPVSSFLVRQAFTRVPEAALPASHPIRRSGVRGMRRRLTVLPARHGSWSGATAISNRRMK